jgi:hypothetical protein
MRKYGWEAFEVLHIGSASTTAEIDRLERMCIELFKSYDGECGYNSTMGGDGGRMTVEVRHKIAQKATGRKLTEEAKNKIRVAHAGKPWTPAQRAARKSRVGIKRPGFGATMKLVWQNPEFRTKMSEKMRQAWVIRKAQNVA